MAHIENAYEVTEEKSERSLGFYFISKGFRDVIKVVQYSFVQKLNARSVFNLGFGDYDIENDMIVDDQNTNNGDAYKVFNTVLNTIPVFFENYSDSILMVQGSDGRPEFIEHCRLTCTKKCNDECRNYNRRINIYRNYVNKNYQQLGIEYQFFGGTPDALQIEVLEPYEPWKKYDSVFCLLKRHNFAL